MDITDFDRMEQEAADRMFECEHGYDIGEYCPYCKAWIMLNPNED